MKQKPKYTLKQILELNRKELSKNKNSKLNFAVNNSNEHEALDKLGIKINSKYSLKTKILKNAWIETGTPATKALKWLFQEVFKTPEIYHYKKNIFEQGQLFIFEYKNPKYKGTKQLPWFDKYPLVLSLGPIQTDEGIRNIGFNLHILPPRIRIIVICTIFEIYKNIYRYRIFYNSKTPVNIKYQNLIKPLLKYGGDFCVRMYIPNRIRQIVKFPYTDWHKAIFIPSRDYDGIRAAKLIDMWRKHVRKNGFGTTPNIKLN